MPKPKIAVFSGPTATITNSPPLITGNKGRLSGEKSIPSDFDHLVPQYLYEPVTVKIRKFSAHPLEEDAAEVYHDDGKDYFEVRLSPDDGPFPLPYVARRNNGTYQGTPFEASDLENPEIGFGGRQFFYPDASRIFMEINRAIYGRSMDGEGGSLHQRADYDFVRVLPPGGFTKKGEVRGVDFFPYKPRRLSRRPRRRDLARVANKVQSALSDGRYSGGLWLEGTPVIEETLYWISLLVDTDLPIAGASSQRPHGQLSNDGGQNIIDAVDYLLSGRGRGNGAVAVIDGQIFAARVLSKGDARPGGYRATGGHGGILGSVKQGCVDIWYKPNYKHSSTSDVNLSKLPGTLELDSDHTASGLGSLRVKEDDGSLRGEAIPKVHFVKYGAYMEDDNDSPDGEVEIMARVKQNLAEERSEDENLPRMHGFVLEGLVTEASGSASQMKALEIAALSGMPVVKVFRNSLAGRVLKSDSDLTIEGSNLASNKARILLMAAMLKLGRLPRARDPRNPTSAELTRTMEKIREFQEIFESH